jgi:hypothetical protein
MIRLEPLADGGLMAHWNQNIGALVSTAVGTFGTVASVAKASMSEARVLTDGDLCHAHVSAWTDEAE